MAFTSAKEVLEGIVQIDPVKVQGVNGVMFFDMSGEGGGKWTLTLTNGEIKLEEGETATPNVTFSVAAQDFVAIANGELNPIAAFMQGKVRVSGDMAMAMRLQTLLS